MPAKHKFKSVAVKRPSQRSKKNPLFRQDVIRMARRAREASSVLMSLTTDFKNKVLTEMAEELLNQKSSVLKANVRDIKTARNHGISEAMLDRLRLDSSRIQALAHSVREVVALDDPVGETVESSSRHGLKISRRRIPLGVVCMIYEARPNVTVDAAALCFKSGNAVILRGGSEAVHSNRALIKILANVLRRNGLPPGCAALVPHTDRKAMLELLKLDGLTDVVIPRGGEGLMKFIREHAKIPVIKHDKGVCSLFVDDSADLKRAVEVILNAKTQRPGVCNALEMLYVHEKIAAEWLPVLGAALKAKSVEIRGDRTVKKLIPEAKSAREADYGVEYLDLILAVKTVKDVHDAIKNIQKYTSHHTESILTSDPAHAEIFMNALDSSCVMINTSTRFNDGGELGLGAEIGISTTKMHAYGPMGLRELTIPRFVVESDYRVRG